jgi:hypothetical protein
LTTGNFYVNNIVYLKCYTILLSNKENSLNHLIKGALDLHVHSAPDVLPRLMNDIEMAQRIIKSGMAGYAIKSHYFCTSERAELINELYPGCKAVGTISLNSATGGINPTAVEIAARSGAKLVWFPTCDSAHEQKHVFTNDPNTKLPYWARIILQLKEEGIAIPVISIVKDGKLTNETIEVIDIIAKHELILATGHISHEEAFMLVKTASERGVKRIIITHVDFPTTFYTIEEQKEFGKYGAVMEHCYTTWATGKVTFEETLAQIKALGADRVLLSTDLGQQGACYPDEGLSAFAEKLLNSGISETDISKMAVKNPATLLA